MKHTHLTQNSNTTRKWQFAKLFMVIMLIVTPYIHHELLAKLPTNWNWWQGNQITTQVLSFTEEPFDACAEYAESTPDYVIGTSTCDNTDASDISLPATLTDKKIKVNGRLNLDQNLACSGCIFEMGPEAEIVVLPGVTFSAGLSAFYACDTLWRAIRVTTGAYLFLWGDSQVNHIQGAKAGVFAHTGSNLYMADSHFDNNLIGLYIPPGIKFNPDLKGLNNIKMTGFVNLTFTSTGTLLPQSQLTCPGEAEPWGSQNYFTIEPHSKGFAGVLMHDVASISLAPDNPVRSIEYRELQNGIVAYHSTFTVANSYFSEIPQTGAYLIRGYGIYAEGNGELLTQKGYGMAGDVSFNDVWRGIHVRNMNCIVSDNNMVDVRIGIETFSCRQRTLDIFQNKISAVHIGIFLNHNDPTHKMDVYDNEITLTGPLFNFQTGFALAGIHLNEMGQPHNTTALIRDNIINTGNGLVGILAQNIRNVNIDEENLIELESTAGVAGIWLTNSTTNIVRGNSVFGDGITSTGILNTWGNSGILAQSSPVNFLLCNSMEELHNGMMVRNLCNTSIIGRNEFNGQFKFGLHYDALGDSGPQYNTLNVWPGATVGTGGFEAYHRGGQPQILNSRYFVATNVTDGMPDPVFPEENWFVPSNNWDPITACSEYINLNDLVDPGETERLTAVDSLDAVMDAPAYEWNQRRHLYDYLHLWPLSTWENTVYEEFLDDHATTSIGAWYDVEEDIRHTMTMSSSEMTEQDLHVDTLLWALGELYLSQLKIDTARLAADSIDAVEHIAYITDLMEEYMEFYIAKMHLADSLRRDVWEDILYDLSVAPDTEDWEEALVTVWTGYVEFLLSDTLRAGVMDDMEAVAEECFDTHGRAVFLAGSFRMMNTNTVYFYECPESERPLSITLEEYGGAGFEIIPNPVKEAFILQWDDPMIIGEVRIHHIGGGLYHSERITGQSQTINMATAPSGMYVVSCIQDGGVVIAKTIIVQR